MSSNVNLSIYNIDKLIFNYDMLIKYFNKMLYGVEQQSALEFYSNLFNARDLTKTMIQELHNEENIDLATALAKFYSSLMLRISTFSMRAPHVPEEIADIKVLINDIRTCLRQKVLGKNRTNS